jgi:predicted CXXCH cytochrome family protein
MILVALLAVAMLASMAGVAYAGNTEGTTGVSQWVGGDTVHSGYATTTNACKVCHDIHGNANYKLFIANDVATGCSTCHISVTAAPTVYTETDVHRINVATTIPDGSTDTPLALTGDADELECLDCHNAAPHGAGAGTGYALITESDNNSFCIRCHDENDGRVTAGVRASNNTHVMIADGGAYTEFGATVADDCDAGATSANCVNCHVDNVDFPHSGEYKLLTTGSAALALDAECRLCHGATVGVEY